MDAHLRAGIAIYNAGYYHAAHDAWEEYWMGLSEGPDKDFLQGLIQFTAAVYHTTNDNWLGARKLADTSQEYLDGLGDRYCGVDLSTVRYHLRALERDPERVGSAPPPQVEHDGRPVGLDDLDFEATGVAATVLAEDLEYDEGVFERGVEYARRDLEDGNQTSPFVSLVLDFVRESQGTGEGDSDVDHRDIIAQRLGEHVDRRRSREADVDGLF
ncbi:DUF309 domain-containing protein [Halapricum desulfuricans]|uniref:Putative metal-dependent hydrolase n=1 Tax=Halapricum desulfuricans TaxID=2841257 RepID=A0A897NM28_9EURY|nr:DUF309 domain-containing protein [Halapricum desulfuricans]QSG13748.1 putative metal-dependent hydrolase [Halapricum desulfuricans]